MDFDRVVELAEQLKNHSPAALTAMGSRSVWEDDWKWAVDNAVDILNPATYQPNPYYKPTLEEIVDSAMRAHIPGSVGMENLERDIAKRVAENAYLAFIGSLPPRLLSRDQMTDSECFYTSRSVGSRAKGFVAQTQRYWQDNTNQLSVLRMWDRFDHAIAAYSVYLFEVHWTALLSLAADVKQAIKGESEEKEVPR